MLESIRALEDELFEEWSRGVASFVKDGVADESKYLASGIKLLFVLKEVNDEGGGGWDLRAYLRAGARRATWNNVARWVAGIRNLERDMPWQEVSTVPDDCRENHLQTIAAINLKKIPGGHTSKAEEIGAHARENAKLIRRQVEICSPNVIICCGTGEMFAQALWGKAGISWDQTSRGLFYKRFDENKVVVSFVHPSVRTDPALPYYGLLDGLREILRIQSE